MRLRKSDVESKTNRIWVHSDSGPSRSVNESDEPAMPGARSCGSVRWPNQWILRRAQLWCLHPGRFSSMCLQDLEPCEQPWLCPTWPKTDEWLQSSWKDRLCACCVTTCCLNFQHQIPLLLRKMIPQYIDVEIYSNRFRPKRLPIYLRKYGTLNDDILTQLNDRVLSFLRVFTIFQWTLD